MPATTPLDLRILRALARRPAHGYALARELADEGRDRATVYRRLAALARGGLVVTSEEPGLGATRRSYRLTRAGEERLREELRDAMRVLMEAFAARMRPRAGGPSRVKPPIVFVTGSRITGIELRIVASLSRAHPGRVHLVGREGSPPMLAGSWTEIPFRDAYARTLFVNELPPARSLVPAAREWARVLAPGGSLSVIAPAPLPRGVDPFVDFLAEVRDELHPDSAGAPAEAAVTRALSRAFDQVESRREADQRIWTASRAT